MQEIEQTYCRWAPSIGRLEEKAEMVWGTVEYDPEKHADKPTVFFGIYGLNDFYALWRHQGKRWILWAGTDITHFKNGYWLDTQGKIRVDNRAFAQWINENCENWCENMAEYEALKACGIDAKIGHSFLGNVDNFKVEYKWSSVPKVYASVSGNDFDLYRWDGIEEVAKLNPSIEFHLYGNTVPWVSKNPNVIVHGRVPKEQMNSEIKKMQGGLRLLKFDGFSEILAKSVLWGQWPIAAIDYPHMLSVEDISSLHWRREPNIKGREYYLQNLNKFPWVQTI